eukprot:3423155-Pleurochrysis_carterae.AAC.1
MTPGATVALRPADAPTASAISGTLVRINDASVVISIDEMPDEPLQEPLTLQLMNNEARGSLTFAAHSRDARSGFLCRLTSGGSWPCRAQRS